MHTELTTRLAQATDIGKVWSENQDSMASFTCAWGEIFVIADGMGGSEGGGVAARMAVERLEAHLREIPEGGPAALQEAAMRTNRDIVAARTSHPENGAMGTTIVAAAVQ